MLLRAFLDAHVASKSMARATELLVSARAALGDERLKKGDSAGGTEQLLLAIADAPVERFREVVFRSYFANSFEPLPAQRTRRRGESGPGD